MSKTALNRFIYRSAWLINAALAVMSLTFALKCLHASRNVPLCIALNAFSVIANSYLAVWAFKRARRAK